MPRTKKKTAAKAAKPAVPKFAATRYFHYPASAEVIERIQAGEKFPRADREIVCHNEGDEIDLEQLPDVVRANVLARGMVAEVGTYVAGRAFELPGRRGKVTTIERGTQIILDDLPDEVRDACLADGLVVEVTIREE